MLIRNSLTFKLRSALATNSNDIESLAIEVIKKTKMLSLVHSIEKQQVILNNIKHILTSRILTLPTTASRNNVTIIDHLNTNYFLSDMDS